jgi:hypothetical protein
MADLALNWPLGFDGSRHADQADLDANSRVVRANGRLLVPWAGTSFVPAR